MPQVSLVVTPQSRGLVELSGRVTSDDLNSYDHADLAVMPFAWRYATTHRSQDHGWRMAGRFERYGLNRNGEFLVQDVVPGLQYAVMAVGSYFGEAGTTRQSERELLLRERGTLPSGALSLPEFSHPHCAVHIRTAPDDHLTGAVLGVGRAWIQECDIDIPEGDAGDPMRMMAWADKTTGSLFIGQAWCEPSGFWTFGDVDRKFKDAPQFTVALVTPGFSPPEPGSRSPVPPRGGTVISLASHPHKPLLRHGAEGSLS
jgi:hypothetical protein